MSMKLRSQDWFGRKDKTESFIAAGWRTKVCQQICLTSIFYKEVQVQLLRETRI